MIDIDILEDNINKNKIDKCYILAGIDEMLIKEQIHSLINISIPEASRDLNIIKIDGMKLSSDVFMDACETLPFMSEKKVVLVYRANFLKDSLDNENKKRYEVCESYIKSTPEHCILIFYYIFQDKREKISDRVKKLDKSCTVLKADKLKGEKLYKKVSVLFLDRQKEIGKVELKYFCDNVENNMEIIANEVDKLINYTEGRNISRKDIDDMLPYKSEEDIFDLVDFISQKRPEKAIELMNELIFKGENIILVLSMIERQFKLLFNIKLGMSQNKTKEIFSRELRLPPFICERLMGQSRKFTLKQLKNCIELCSNTERVLKTSSFDKKTEMELMIIKTVIN